MRRLISTVFGLTALVVALVTSPAAAQEADSPLLGGRFYTQGSSQSGLGFAVVDNDAAAMFSAYLAYGGPDYLGYPISRRFISGGYITQVFQNAVLQATPSGIRPLSVMDLLSTAGLDGWLATNHLIPPVDPAVDHAAALNEYASLRDAYGWLGPDLNGRVTARAQDMGGVLTLRTQRTAIYESLIDGTIRYARAGEIARDAGIFPSNAFQPQTRAQAAAGDPAPVAAPPATTDVPDNPPPLYVAAVPAVRSPVSGEVTKVTVRVTDVTGQPVAGAKVLVIVHYPLKPGDEEAYTVDGVFFGPETDARGTSVVDVQIDPAVPAGVPAQLEVSAVYPPSVGKVAVDFVIG
ncbi:MAG: hypothetical protein KatS3mg060_0936 [Dehalococcoidia bacterium]|jgi:biotin carboxyl carrier protein|nr:MAG: hypothetical protein KatS3mg060_0936 [Dehalococcoidia bacterium]